MVTRVFSLIPDLTIQLSCKTEPQGAMSSSLGLDIFVLRMEQSTEQQGKYQFSHIDINHFLLYSYRNLNWNSVSEARFLTADDSSAKAIRTAGSKAANCVKAVGNFCCLIG